MFPLTMIPFPTLINSRGPITWCMSQYLYSVRLATNITF